MKSQSGFTLIEMVAVIIILAILAAIAFPRFTNLTGQARMSSLNALAGSMRSAVLLTKSTWLANQSSLAQNVSMNGVAVSVLNSTTAVSEVNWGVPTANTSGIWAALDANTDGFSSFVNTTNSGVIFWPTGAAVSTSCSGWYSAGEINLVTSMLNGNAASCL